MAHHVFISYSQKDKSIADSLCSTLEAGGVRCWITPRDVLPGMDWGEAIIDAIAASRVLVLLLTANSNTSNHVKREVERAVNKNLIVIPFRVEDVTLSKTLEYHLSTTHWMDALTPPLEKHVQSLAARIRQLLSISIATTAKTAPAVPAKRKEPTLALPQRTTLTIQFTHRVFRSVAQAALQVFFDGKDIGTVLPTNTMKRFRRQFLVDDTKKIDLTVQTTSGKHILAFKGEAVTSLRWNSSYELDLPPGGNYHAVVDETDWLNLDKSISRQGVRQSQAKKPFDIKLVRETPKTS